MTILAVAALLPAELALLDPSRSPGGDTAQARWTVLSATAAVALAWGSRRE